MHEEHHQQRTIAIAQKSGVDKLACLVQGITFVSKKEKRDRHTIVPSHRVDNDKPRPDTNASEEHSDDQTGDNSSPQHPLTRCWMVEVGSDARWRRYDAWPRIGRWQLSCSERMMLLAPIIEAGHHSKDCSGSFLMQGRHLAVCRSRICSIQIAKCSLNRVEALWSQEEEEERLER
jgi:hypothetical protein